MFDVQRVDNGVTMQDAQLMRDRLFNMRMSVDEFDRLDALVRHYGIPASNVVRMLLKREADALGIANSPAPEPAPAEAAATPKRSTKR